MAEHLLLLDTGDALVTGDPMGGDQKLEPGQVRILYHPLGDRTEGEVIVAGMNLMGYDAMALGPKDLTLDLKVLRQRLDQAEFAVVSANVVDAESGELLVPAYTLIEVGPYRLGVLGITRPPKEPLDGFQVGKPREALERWLPEVAAQADTIILLTNLEFRAARKLVGAVPGIDLLVAALPGQLPSTALQVPATGTVAVTADQPMTRHTGRRVGELTMTVQGDGTLDVRTWRSVVLSNLIADDPEMKALLESYQ